MIPNFDFFKGLGFSTPRWGTPGFSNRHSKHGKAARHQPTREQRRKADRKQKAKRKEAKAMRRRNRR